MYDYLFNPNLSKEEFYQALVEQVRSVITGQRNWVTNLSNASALIFHGVNALVLFRERPVNWAGFYVVDRSSADTLILGPFQGKVACTQIKIGKGVCGTAAATRNTQVVPDVHLFPGHIACDAASQSEIVVPMIHPENGRLLGVLDIDDSGKGAFDNEDRMGLEAVVKVIVEGCDWDLVN